MSRNAFALQFVSSSDAACLTTLRKARSSTLLAVLTSLTMMLCAAEVSADDWNSSRIYDSIGFEPSYFTAGSTLLGTDGWSTAIPPFLNPQAAIITNAASRRGRQSVEVWGGDLVGSGGITAPYDAVGSYRIPLNYTTSSKKPVIIMEADLKLETDQPCTIDDFFTVTVAARSGNNETLGEIGVSSSGFAEAYAFNAAPGAAPAFLSPIRLNRWHKISIAIDYSGANPEVYYYVDRRLIGSTLTTSTSPILLRGAVVVYARPDGVDAGRADYIARFDNFRVSAGKCLP